MRPRELHIRSFRSFAGDATFEFGDRTLLGIVGPIGSGKSSILDAIAYALYARTPRVAGSIRDLIHQRSDTAVVRLTFDVDGSTWQVTRSIRRGQSNHTLQRLDDDGAVVETLTQKSEVDERIEQLIGLDFEAFSRSVLLAQGRFAEFLTAQPAQRDRVLKGVFGHEKIDVMRQVAKERSTNLGLDIEKLTGRLEALAGAEERLVEQRDQLATLAERLEALEKIVPRVDDHDQRLATIGSRVGEIDQRIQAVSSKATDLPPADAVAHAVTEVDRTQAKRSELATALEERQTGLLGAEASLAELSENAGALDEAADLVAQRQVLVAKLDDRSRRLGELETAHSELQPERESLESRLTRAREEVATSETAVSGARDAEQRARTELDRSRHENMAHTLRGELTTGDLCPVCEQAVEVVPALEEVGDLVAADAEVAAAGAALAAAQERMRTATGELASVETQSTELEQRLLRSEQERSTLRGDVETIQDQLGTITSALAQILGDGEPDELLRQSRTRLTAAREAADRARKTVDRVRTEHDQAIRDEQTAQKQLSDLGLAAATAASALGLAFDAGSVSEDPPAFSAAIAALREGLTEETRVLTDELDALTTEGRELTEIRTELLSSLGVEGDLGTEVTRVAARIEAVEQQVAAIEKDLATVEDDRSALQALEARRSHFDRIVRDLTDARFVRYLLDDERVRLAALASDHFQRLSSGRYRFSEDGRFDIIDLATADVVRKADSLSGGETFLASLALALGLAEMVARSGGRLEAFFLDEGFGTLDPEHLNLAMEGIERLVTDGSSRLVVVVSHVPELRQRIEDLIELDKDPLTGDTIVLKR